MFQDYTRTMIAMTVATSSVVAYTLSLIVFNTLSVILGFIFGIFIINYNNVNKEFQTELSKELSKNEEYTKLILKVYMFSLIFAVGLSYIMPPAIAAPLGILSLYYLIIKSLT